MLHATLRARLDAPLRSRAPLCQRDGFSGAAWDSLSHFDVYGAAAGAERALILVADEDPHVKRLQRYFLERAGFEVELVNDGEEGLERARSRLPRIVITEILLPKRDGLSVCRALKSDPRTRDIRVLVFSMLAAEDRAKQAGADAFMRKPVDDTQLIDTVHSLLASGEARG